MENDVIYIVGHHYTSMYTHMNVDAKESKQNIV